MDHNVDLNNAYDDDSVVRRLGALAKRSEAYEKWVIDQLQTHKCRRILDAACGTGGDSLFLVEKGFDVVGSDSADAMLHFARQARDTHRSQHEGVVNWDIENANWLSLKEDLAGYGEFDAVLCLGNSMIALTDTTPNLDLYRRSFENFKCMLKPGGVLLLDHRNMDAIIDHGAPINKPVYFKKNTIHKISSETLKSDGKRNVINVTFDMIVAPDTKAARNTTAQSCSENGSIEKVTVPLLSIRAQEIANILRDVFGDESDQALYGDLNSLGTVSDPAYYQHMITKNKQA